MNLDEWVESSHINISKNSNKIENTYETVPFSLIQFHKHTRTQFPCARDFCRERECRQPTQDVVYVSSKPEYINYALQMLLRRISRSFACLMSFNFIWFDFFHSVLLLPESLLLSFSVRIFAIQTLCIDLARINVFLSSQALNRWNDAK